MRRRIEKPKGNLGLTCTAGWQNKEVETYMHEVEKKIKKLAKKHDLSISMFVQIWDVPVSKVTKFAQGRYKKGRK